MDYEKDRTVPKETRELNQTDFILIGAFVFASIMSVADLTNAFGQVLVIDKPQEQPSPESEIPQLTDFFKVFGFSHFEYNQTSQIFTASGNNTHELVEDSADSILMSSDFNMTQFAPGKITAHYIGAMNTDVERMTDNLELYGFTQFTFNPESKIFIASSTNGTAIAEDTAAGILNINDFSMTDFVANNGIQITGIYTN